MTEQKMQEAKELVRRLIEIIGDDPDRDGLKETPKRVVNSWLELYSGYRSDPKEHVKAFESEFDQIVAVSGIDYFSMCEHHMLPFFGKCYIAYLPNGSHKVLGVSKFCRIVDVYARRLQIQEQLTQQVAYAIRDAIDPKGVAVIIEGVHLCMMARGVKQQHASMRTSCMLGVFRDNPAARAEAIALMKE